MRPCSSRPQIYITAYYVHPRRSIVNGYGCSIEFEQGRVLLLQFTLILSQSNRR